MVRVHIIPALGTCKVAQLDVDTVDRFLQAKLQADTGEKALSAQTVRYLRGLLRRAWRFGMKWKWVGGGTNLITLSEPIAVRRAKTVTLTGEELKTLMGSFAGHRDEALLSTALGLGLRLGEVLGLRWEDVVLEAGAAATVSVAYQLQRVAVTLQLTLPKSDASQRTVYLPTFVSDALRTRKQGQEREQLLGGAAWQNALGLAFTNRDGGPLDPSAVRKRFRKLLSEQANGNLRLHDLRHIAASILLGEGISVADTAEQLGHADPYLVVRTYGHTMPKGKKGAAEAMNKAFANRHSDSTLDEQI